MTLQQLEYIVAVYRHRHFGKAAEECGVTQPTLSAMIQKLENELSVKLFNRSSQQVIPTQVGRLVVEQAWKVLSRAHKIEDIVAEEKHSLSGVFRLGVLPTIAPYLLPRFFPRFVSEHPDLDLRVIEMKTEDIKKALAKGNIDAAIIVKLDDMDEYQLYTIYYEQFLAYVSRKDRLFEHQTIKFSDLDTEFLWLLDEGHCFRDQLIRFCNLKSAKASKETYSLGSIETFMRMVESGLGMTFIPELAVEQLSDAQRQLVRPFALPIPTREIVLITNRSFVRHSVREALINAVATAVPTRMLKLNNTEQRI